jgi:Zn ribbon nucleic-acid-binding protein
LHSFFHSASWRRRNSAPFVSRIKRTVGVGGGAVEKRSFVVKEQKFIRPVRCIKCGGNAHLIRRSPDPVKEDGSEIRIFECHECGHQTLRIVKA